jgi:hypothetical protein
MRTQITTSHMLGLEPKQGGPNGCRSKPLSGSFSINLETGTMFVETMERKRT